MISPFGPIEFDAPGGQATLVELKVPRRGAINTIRLHQVGGTPGGGRFRIFSLRQAADALLGSSESSTLAGMNVDSFSVCGEKTIVSGAYEEYGARYGYCNRDSGGTMGTRRLWMVVEPDGSGDKTFALSMEVALASLLSA